MSGFLKRLTLEFGKALIVIGLLFAVFAGYGVLAERSARAKAAAMCASIAPDQDPASLRARAVADGASVFQTPKDKDDGLESLVITYTGLPPFSRHLCVVHTRNGHVVSARPTFID